MKKAIISVTNDLVTDQRVGRTADTLVELGFDVCVVGRRKKDSLPFINSSYKTHRFRLLFERGPLFYVEYNIRLFCYLLFNKASLLFSNDLDTLLPNYIVHKIKGASLVYDSHEYFTGVPELAERPVVRGVWKKIEKYIFPRLEQVITVNESIANLFYQEYDKKVNVVRNIPKKQESLSSKTREELGLPEDKKLLLLQGAGINVHRGAEEAVEMMKPIYGIDDAVLVIIGGGDVIDVLKKTVNDQKIKERVLFIPKIPYKELHHYTANCDIGLTLDKATNINYKFSLPNKLFDYIHAGIPVIASDLVEVKAVVEEYKIGWVLESFDIKYMADKVMGILNDECNWKEMMKDNLTFAANELNWDKEKLVLKKVIEHYVG